MRGILVALLAGVAMFTGVAPLAAAQHRTLHVTANGKPVLTCEVRIPEDLDVDQTWLALLKHVTFAPANCQGDFQIIPDETAGRRCTLRGELQLVADGLDSPISLQSLQIVRHSGQDVAWLLADDEQRRIQQARAAQRGQSPPPNIIVILCDDLRWNALSIAGHPHVRTPHIDQLAQEGVRFENAFCTTSLCSPSRACILSGLYAHAHGVTDNFTEYPADLPSFPRQLQNAGYETAYIGKWHMGEKNDEPRPGFDWFVTHRGQGNYYDTEFNLNGEERRTIPGYYTTAVTDLAVEWLDKDRDQPFLLMLGHKAPHSFYLPEPKYEHAFDGIEPSYPQSAFDLTDRPEWILRRQSTWHGIYGPLFGWRKNAPDTSAAGVTDFARMVRAYWGTIQSVDDSVGRITDLLRQRGELDNTVVVFMGDNGLLEGEHGMVDKRTMHEPSIRIPLLIRAPQWIPVNQPRRIQEQVLTIDIAPTLLELARAKPSATMHGKSMRQLMTTGDAAWRKAWFYQYNYEAAFPYTPNVRGIRTDRWKLIRYPHGDGTPDRHRAELYDLQNDPQERHNLIDHPNLASLVSDLQTQLQQLRRDVGADDDRMPIDAGIKAGLPEAGIR